jgi:type IV secretion system protein VirD4
VQCFDKEQQAMAGIILGRSLAPVQRNVGFISGPLTARETAQAKAIGTLIEDSSESHLLAIGPTGGGKGRNLVLPNLLNWPHSALVVDIKGEAALATARYRRALGQRVVVLDPFCRVSAGEEGLNPMDWLADSETHIADNASTLSETLTGEISLKDPFWDHAANDLVAGLIAHAATSRQAGERNLGFVYNALTGDDPVHAFAVLLDNVKDMHPYAHRHLAAFCSHEGEKVRSSVLSTAQQHLRTFASPLVQKSVAHTTFDLGALQRGEPISIYLVLPATRLHSHAPLLRLWLSVLLGVIAERSSQPAAPTLLIVDEMAQIGAVPMILQALTLLRGYGLRVMAIVQSIAQLRTMWPTDHQTIIDNCGTIATFGQNRPYMAEPMAELLGDISADTLLKLPPDQLVINRNGEGTVIARKLDYLKDPMFSGRFDPNPFYARHGAAAPDDPGAAERHSGTP